MINFFELQEVRTLTPAMVHAWLLRAGYREVGTFSGHRRYSRNRNDRSEEAGLKDHQIFVGEGSSLQSGLLVLAQREGITLQALLRAINPLFRPGRPSIQARAAHRHAYGGFWLCRVRLAEDGLYSQALVVPLNADLPDGEEQSGAEYWPVDQNGYRVDWPVDPMTRQDL